MCEKKTACVPSSIGWDALGINVRLAFSVLDELVEAIPGVVVLVLGQVVVEGLVNGFDVGFYRMADDICYTFGPLPNRKKKKSDINTSPALISHFDRTLLFESTVAA